MGLVQRLDTPAYLFCGIYLWSLGLPILSRLYTSVIPRMSENWAYKESWSTDMSPTASFTLSDTAACGPALLLGGAGVYPG